MPNPVYIYDAVRTPRSKGKSTGTLHEVKPIDLAAGLLVELQKRHDLDTSYVDDVVMGCVSPVGEQGSDGAKMVVQNADGDESVPGVQLDRFCASGVEGVNIAGQYVASGGEVVGVGFAVTILLIRRASECDICSCNMVRKFMRHGANDRQPIRNRRLPGNQFSKCNARKTRRHRVKWSTNLFPSTRLGIPQIEVTGTTLQH